MCIRDRCIVFLKNPIIGYSADDTLLFYDYQSIILNSESSIDMVKEITENQ